MANSVSEPSDVSVESVKMYGDRTASSMKARSRIQFFSRTAEKMDLNMRPFPPSMLPYLSYSISTHLAAPSFPLTLT